MRLKQVTFPNGFRLLLAKTDDKVVSIALAVRAGSRFEHPAISGHTHLLEHILHHSGSVKYSTDEDLYRFADLMSEEMNAEVCEDLLMLYGTAYRRSAQDALDIIMGGVMHPRITRKVLEQERQAVLHEINGDQDPDDALSALTLGVLFDGHPLGIDPGGTPESVERATCVGLLNIWKAAIRPKNMAMAVVGGMDPERIHKVVERRFGRLKSGAAKKITPYVERRYGPVIRCVPKPSRQVMVSVSYPSFSFMDPDRHALSVANKNLCGRYASRLHLALRQRGFVYWSDSRTHHYEDIGYLDVTFATSHAKLRGALEIVSQEIARHRNELITKDELAVTKMYLRELSETKFSKTDYTAKFYAALLARTHTLVPYREYLRRITAVTRGDVRRVMRRVCSPERLRVVLHGRTDPIPDEAMVREVFGLPPSVETQAVIPPVETQTDESPVPIDAEPVPSLV